MHKVTYKMVALSKKEVGIISGMIWVNEVAGARKTSVHLLLAGKIARAKETMKVASATRLFFSSDECALMRLYNMNYCATLSANVEAFLLNGNMRMFNDGLEVYRLATNIQMRFSSRN